MVAANIKPDSLAEHAQYYAGHGLAVFPLWPRTKAPMTPHGFTDATTDATQVRKWWESTPDANIGIACGAASGGLLAIDLDVDEERDEDGLRTLHQWESERGELAETATAITGRGGVHLLYRTETPPRCSTDQTPDKRVGIDIRGEGGYIVAPPSVHPNGHTYELEEWLEDSPIAEADAAVLEFVRWVQEQSKAGRQEGEGSTNAESGHFKMPDVLRQGARDETIFRYCCSQRRANVPKDVALVAALAYDRDHCQPPLGEAVVRQKLESAYRYPAGNAVRGMDWADACSAAGLRASQVTDKALSRLFAEIVRDRVAYVAEWGSWAIFNGSHWQTQGAQQLIDRLLKQFVTGVQVWALHIDDEAERRRAKSAANAYDQHARRVHLRDDVKSELVTSASTFDADPHLLNVANGTIDFNGAVPVFRDHDPADRITHITAVGYDQGATCHLFEQTVAQCCDGDADLVTFVQKLFGLVVAGDTSHDLFAIFGTATRSGKDTVTGALAEMLGRRDEATGYAVHVMPESFAVRAFANGSGPTSDRARMQDKRAIITSEFQGGSVLDAGFLKQLTGGSPIAARRMRQNEVQFTLAGIVLMLTNVWPAVTDPTIFTSGRVACVPFDRHFTEEERDSTLRSRLCEPHELSGLLNWCMEGYRLARAEGLDRPDAVVAKTDEFLRHADPIARFIGDVLMPSEGAGVPMAELWEAYKRWDSSGSAKVGRATFYEDVRRRLSVADRASIGGEQKRQVVLDYVLAGR